MTQKIYTDRSRTETEQHCSRERFLRYHQDGAGIEPSRKALALCVGGSVHKGLEHILRQSMSGPYTMIHDTEVYKFDEDAAVAAALNDFAQYASAGLELDTGELAARQPQAQSMTFDQQLAAQAADLGVEWTPPVREIAGQFDEYLAREQSALVEALVRAWARRRLRPLLEQYEVLEVEREGEWLLAEWGKRMDWEGNDLPRHELWFMSRPDALLRERQSNALYLLSFKTAATWDMRKERDALRDMQGLSEGVEVERRLAEWWKNGIPDEHHSDAMSAFLSSCPAPPRILGIRYEYLLKGYRDEDKELSAELGHTAYTQRSHLIRQYVAKSVPQRGHAEYAFGDVCWSWDYHKDDGSASKLAWQNWKAQAVWEHDAAGVRRWIDRLAASSLAMSAWDSTVGLEPRPLGWKSDAQQLGYTTEHPLDQVFRTLTVYRNDDELRDWIEQVEASERRVAESVAAVEAAGDEGERRHLLNVHFGQTRRACSYPTDCAFIKLCWGGDDIRSRPLESGLYRRRVPHHEPKLAQQRTEKETV